MKITITWMRWPLLIGLLTFAGQVAYGGLLDWLLPAKEIVQAGRDITLAIVLKQFLDRYMPLIAVLLLSVLGVACFRGAQLAMAEFTSAYREANRDGHITWGERIMLAGVYLPSIVTTGVLLWFGGVLIYMGSGGLLTLATTVPGSP